MLKSKRRTDKIGGSWRSADKNAVTLLIIGPIGG